MMLFSRYFKTKFDKAYFELTVRTCVRILLSIKFLTQNLYISEIAETSIPTKKTFREMALECGVQPDLICPPSIPGPSIV